MVYHDVDVGNVTPVKHHPYRVSPVKLVKMCKEVKCMLDNHLIEPSQSEWSSPSILAPKPDQSVQLLPTSEKSMQSLKLAHILSLGLITALTRLVMPNL